jgi:hypothetical protein
MLRLANKPHKLMMARSSLRSTCSTPVSPVLLLHLHTYSAATTLISRSTVPSHMRHILYSLCQWHHACVCSAESMRAIIIIHEPFSDSACTTRGRFGTITVPSSKPHTQVHSPRALEPTIMRVQFVPWSADNPHKGPFQPIHVVRNCGLLGDWTRLLLVYASMDLDRATSAEHEPGSCFLKFAWLSQQR